ncbi:MAG: hypothetical protein WC099_02460 [Candidatus Paceibacterota bacterium]
MKVLVSIPKSDPHCQFYKKELIREKVSTQESKNFLFCYLIAADEYSFKIPHCLVSLKNPFFLIEGKEAVYSHGSCVVCDSNGGRFNFFDKPFQGSVTYHIRGKFVSIFLFRKDQAVSIKKYQLESFGDLVFLQESNIWCGKKKDFPVRLITFSEALSAASLKLLRPDFIFGSKKCSCRK